MYVLIFEFYCYFPNEFGEYVFEFKKFKRICQECCYLKVSGVNKLINTAFHHVKALSRSGYDNKINWELNYRDKHFQSTMISEYKKIFN